MAACANRGAPPPDRTSDAPDVTDTAGSSVADERDMTGLGRAGGPCPDEGARACWKHASKVSLICTAHVWEIDSSCNDDERCDTSRPETLGRCVPVAKECKGQEDGHAFCVDDSVRTCTDLIAFSDDACGPGATCSDATGNAACTCKPGYMRAADGCIDIDECAQNGGGCDSGAPCQNTEGSYTCGGCAPDHVGGANGACTPSLTSLIPSAGTLSPAFDTVHTDYRLSLPITVNVVTLIATAPSGASVVIDGHPLKPGASWQSSKLPLGATSVGLSVTEPDHPDRKYTIELRRGNGEQVYLKASNPGAGDNFGASVAVAGNLLAVGAPNEDSASIGVNGAQANEAAASAGAVYVFSRGRHGFSQEAYLKASNAATGARFGSAVALAGDTLVVGAPGESSNPDDAMLSLFASGAVYVFKRNHNKWSQEAALKASNAGATDYFGSAVALSGNTLVVGAPGESSNGTGPLGGQQNNAAAASGAVYVFERTSAGWHQTAYLKADVVGAGDGFGVSVAVLGDTLVVGAPAEDGSGHGAMSSDQLNNGADASGAAYTFMRGGDGWFQEAYLKGSLNAAGDSFGYSVGIAHNTVAVGAPGASKGDGSVYLFHRDNDVWAEATVLRAGSAAMAAARSAPGDAFGASVQLTDNGLLAGAYGDDSASAGFGTNLTHAGAPNSGVACLFLGAIHSFDDAEIVKPISVRPNQQFGSRVAMSEDTIAIGAMADGPDPRNSSVGQEPFGPASSGAVYIFR